MASRAETIFNETRRLACGVLDDDNAAAAFLSRGLRTNPVGSVVATGLGNLRDNARTFACGDGSPLSRIGDALLGTAATPGQCSELYTITAVADRYRSSGSLRVEGATLTGAQQYQGPIQDVYIPGNDANSPLVVVANGDEVPLVSNGSSDTYRDLRDVVFTLVNGGEDNCGGVDDPRPRYEGPVTYDDDNGNEITEDVVVVLDDPVDRPGGGITIPVGWFAPELNINPDLNLDLEPEIDFSPGRPCLPNLDFEPELDIPDGPDDPPPPNDTRLLAGVFLVTTVVDPNRVPNVTGNSESLGLYLPDAGSVVFAVRVGNEVAWTGPKPIQVLKQWEPVIGELYAYSFSVVNRNGFVTQGYPVYLDDGETQD